MEQFIIYQTEGGGVAVIMPYLGSGLTIAEIAAKDVPAGAQWRIVDAASLPARDTRSRWRWTLTGPLEVAQP